MASMHSVTPNSAASSGFAFIALWRPFPAGHRLAHTASASETAWSQLPSSVSNLRSVTVPPDRWLNL